MLLGSVQSCFSFCCLQLMVAKETHLQVWDFTRVFLKLIHSVAFFFILEIKIVYSYVNKFNLIWNDKESRADEDVSIWQPVAQEEGFYPLGDFAHSSHNEPQRPSLTVKEIETGALAAPKGMTFMWSDVCSRTKNL